MASSLFEGIFIDSANIVNIIYADQKYKYN
jgi:hypothetical protein